MSVNERSRTNGIETRRDESSVRLSPLSNDRNRCIGSCSVLFYCPGLFIFFNQNTWLVTYLDNSCIMGCQFIFLIFFHVERGKYIFRLIYNELGYISLNFIAPFHQPGLVFLLKFLGSENNILGLEFR